jgi:hypothetical protein
MLGLLAARSTQHALSHQISAGAEPLLRYSAARQALLSEYGDVPWHGDSKWIAAGTIGIPFFK